MLHYIWVRFWFLVFRSFVQLYYRWALQYVLSSWCSRYCSKKWLIEACKKAIVVFIYGYFSDQIKPLVSNLVSLIKLVNELKTDLILQTTPCPPYFQEKKTTPEFRFIDPLSVSLLMWYRWWVDYCSVNVREAVSVANSFSNHLINSCSVEVQELGWPWHRDRLTNEEKGLSTQPHLLSE